MRVARPRYDEVLMYVMAGKSTACADADDQLAGNGGCVSLHSLAGRRT